MQARDAPDLAPLLLALCFLEDLLTHELPEIDGCCPKEPYAFFGMAAYWAQIIESSALNLATVLKLPEVGLVSRELFEGIYTDLTKKTFGQLLKEAKKVIEISPDDELYLSETLELRNILTHHYFREHAEDFVSEQGRIEMMQELTLIIFKFKKADVIITSIYEPLWEKYGVNEEFINSEMEKLKQATLIRDGKA